MSVRDIVADFVSRTNNAVLAGKKTVRLPKSNFTKAIATRLAKSDLNYFDSFVDSENDYFLDVNLNLAKIGKLKQISKPGKRVYASYKDSYPILNGFGYVLASTAKGIKTNVETKREKIGGELILQITTKTLTNN